MSYTASAEEQKLTFLINLNGTNQFKQSFYLPVPITGYSLVSLQSTQFFAITTSFSGIGYITDLYNTDTASRLISGLICANDIIKYQVTNNTISTLDIKLVVPFEPNNTDAFQGVLVFSN
jgi:hypothetical protein